MDGKDPLIRFEFDYGSAVNNEVKTVFPNKGGAVPDLDLPFALYWKSPAAQFRQQSTNINTFEKPGTQRAVNLRGRVHDFPDERLGLHNMGLTQ
jgi:hypothetical protein